MNSISILIFVTYIVYCSISWILPKLLAWFFERKYRIVLRIGRIGIPYLKLCDVIVMKNGFTIHIDEIGIRSSFFSSELTKLVTVFVKDVRINKDLGGKVNDRQYDDVYSEANFKQKIIDFRERKVPHFITTFAQFMAVHIHNISAMLLHSGTPGWLIHATATELHLDGSIVQNARTLLVNIALSEASAKLLRHADKLANEETCLAELAFAISMEATLVAQGPLSVETLYVGTSHTKATINDGFYSLVQESEDSSPSVKKQPHSEDSIYYRILPIIPKYYSYVMDDLSIIIIRGVNENSRTEFISSLNNLSLSGRFVNTISKEDTSKYFTYMLADFQVTDLLVQNSREKLLVLKTVTLEIKMEDQIVNLCLKLNTLMVTYNHETIYQWVETNFLLNKTKQSSLIIGKSNKNRSISNNKDGNPTEENGLINKFLKNVVVNGFAEFCHVSALLKLHGNNSSVGFGHTKFFLEQTLEPRGSAYPTGFPKLLFANRHWQVEILMESYWWSFKEWPQESNVSKRIHFWGTPVYLGMGLIKLGTYGGTKIKINSLFDILQLEWSPYLAEYVLLAIKCLKQYKIGSNKKAVSVVKDHSETPVAMYMNLSNFSCFFSSQSSDYIVVRLNSLIMNTTSALVNVDLKEMKVLTVYNPDFCYNYIKEEDIHNYDGYIKLAKFELKNETTPEVSVSLLEKIIVYWSTNLHLRLFYLQKEIMEFKKSVQKSLEIRHEERKNVVERSYKFLISGVIAFHIRLSEKHAAKLALGSDGTFSLSYNGEGIVIDDADIFTIQGVDLYRIQNNDWIRNERLDNEHFKLPWNKTWQLNIDLLSYGRTEGDQMHMNKILDKLNSLHFRYPVIINATRAVLLVHQCCSLVSPDDPMLVSKCCQLITNLINKQHVQIEGLTLLIAVQWCLQGLKHKDESILIDVLVTLLILLQSSTQHLHFLLPEVVVSDGPILTLSQSGKSLQLVLLAVQCLEKCTNVPDDFKSRKTRTPIPILQLELCVGIFLKHLTSEDTSNSDSILYCKLLVSCLHGLQNIARQSHEFLDKELGLLLGLSKTYMVYGIKGVHYMAPLKLMPSVLSIAEPSPVVPVEKKGGKIVKQRKHRASLNKRDPKQSESGTDWINERQLTGYIPATTTFDVPSDSSASGVSSGSKLKTSDSDFSDSESGRTAQLGINQGRIRQAALHFLLHIVKLVDKRTIFSYWSSFIPEDTFSGTHSLATCILKDPSPRGRMAALNILLMLLNSSKLYLSQAEFSDRNSAFTPFSVVLGSMIKELHRCLILALNENFIPVLTQTLKCLAALVQATPYHRLSKGLITKIVRNVKLYTCHRDVTVQVGALIVMGCILASEPVVTETKQLLLKQILTKTADETNKTSAGRQDEIKDSPEDEPEYVDFSSDEEVVQSECNTEIPWLLEKCLTNLGVVFHEEQTNENLAPAPAKLESLQVISAMTRNYFPTLIAPYLNLIAKALDIALNDKYTDLRLHAGRTVYFIGQAINQYLNNQGGPNYLATEQGLALWQTLINGPLTLLLQNEQYPILRAVGCDCLGSIGPHIFEHIPRDTQFLIITLLLSCSHDEENSVKAAAVRALAICVLCPSLREDSGLVVYVAETVHRTLEDDNMNVRIEASWSLANVSDALVLNRLNLDVEELPNSLLLKLLRASVKASSDNDKIKTNIVRAVGNLLQIVKLEMINNRESKETVEQAIGVLVKYSTTGNHVKVRWNSCHALGNMLKNSALYHSCSWQNSVFNALMDLVVSFRNFKVRINAALALSCVIERKLYGQYYYSIWNALIKALENAENMEDFSEYKHRDHLVEQICLTLGHMTTFLAVKDLTALKDNVEFYFDLLKLQMHRVLDRLVPEKATVLLAAAAHLHTFTKQSSLPPEQCKIINLLLDIYTNDIL